MTPRDSVSLSIGSLLGIGGGDMGRRRLQQTGDLYAQGGWWRLRWREDATSDDGKVERRWSKPVIVGPGPSNPNMKPLTKREAKREAWNRFLSRLDQNTWTPRSVATVAQFVEKKFLPDHVMMLKKNTQIMYGHLLKNHILPAIGELRLRDAKREHVQRVINGLLAQGKSVQTAVHVRNVISAIFRLAEDFEWSDGNPARRVRLPKMERKERQALTLAQVEAIASQIEEPYRSMVIILARTGMRIGELCGLEWKYVNLSDQHILVNAESIPPYTIAVRRNFTAGQWGTLKTGGSRRNIPMTATVWVEMSVRKELANGSDLVFPNRSGNPLDAHNVANRHFKPAAKKAGLPWASLHYLRYTASTLADQAGVGIIDQMKFLGHTVAKTTAGYTTVDLERIRAKLEAQLSAQLPYGRPN